MPVVIPNIQPDLPRPAVRGRLVGIRYNGLETSKDGPWELRGVKGLDDFPDMLTGDQDRGGLDGVVFGEDHQGKRVIELTLYTRGRTRGVSVEELQDEVSESRRDLVRAFAIRHDDDLPLEFIYQNAKGEISIRTAFCRPRDLDAPFNLEDGQLELEATVELHAADPRVYGPLMEATCGLSLGQGRRGYPRGYPWGYGSGGPGGLIRAFNDGSRDSLPLAVVRGPALNPRIIHREQHLYVQVNVELGGGDYLTYDFVERNVTLNGTDVSRFYAITGHSDWFALQSGWNTLQYVADFYQPNSTLTLYWRSAD